MVTELTCSNIRITNDHLTECFSVFKVVVFVLKPAPLIWQRILSTLINFVFRSRKLLFQLRSFYKPTSIHNLLSITLHNNS